MKTAKIHTIVIIACLVCFFVLPAFSAEETPVYTPVPAETTAETPSVTPTMTWTNTPVPPIFTKTPTPLPPRSTFYPTPPPIQEDTPSLLVPYSQIFPITKTTNEVYQIAADPDTDNLVWFQLERVLDSWSAKPDLVYSHITRLRGPIPSNQGYIPQNLQPISEEFLRSINYYHYPLYKYDADRFVISYADKICWISKSNGFTMTEMKAQCVIPIDEKHDFMGVPPKSLLCLYYDYYSGSQNQSPVEIFYLKPEDNFSRKYILTVPPETLASLGTYYGEERFLFGPDGCVYVSCSNAIIGLEPNGMIKQIIKMNIASFSNLIYLENDHAFYYFDGNPYNSEKTPVLLNRLTEDGHATQDILYIHRPDLNWYYWSYWPNMTASADGKRIYFNDPRSEMIWAFEPLYSPGVPIATPTPTLPPNPSPTPTPCDWVILDGFGGIHTSRPNLEHSRLPYFIPFDIARDIEPDPLGRGWYMQDGFGGIHTSSPDLPKPTDLPYFGFDIARDLKVIEKDGQFTFILLDGYGGVHISGPQAKEIKIDTPWFGLDMMRNLRRTEDNLGWYILDAYGALYDTRDHSATVAAGIYWQDHWFARKMVVFDDGRRLMIDSLGGRHYDTEKPVLQWIKPIPLDFYFGFEIIWDLELLRDGKRGY